MDVFIARETNSGYTGIGIRRGDNDFVIVNPDNTCISDKFNYFISFNTRLLNDAVIVSNLSIVSGGEGLKTNTEDDMWLMINQVCAGAIATTTSEEKAKIFRTVQKYMGKSTETAKDKKIYNLFTSVVYHQATIDQIINGEYKFESLLEGKLVKVDHSDARQKLTLAELQNALADKVDKTQPSS